MEKIYCKECGRPLDKGDIDYCRVCREYGNVNNNIIICEKCYEENEATRTTCKSCGAKLYKNNTNHLITLYTFKNNTTRNSKNEEKNYNYKENYNTNMDSTEINKMAKMLRVIAVIEIICGFIVGVALGDTFGVGYYGYDFNWGLCIGIIVASFISGIFVLGFAEVIQLLQDIKDKK